MANVLIGFGVPTGRGNPVAQRRHGHVEMLRLGQRAEQLGFDSLWVPDHFFIERPPNPPNAMPEAWTLMTALAMTTTRAQVGSMVLCATFRHPALLAKMAGALQELSGGRLLLGIGAGWHEPEYQAMGLPFDHRVGRFEEYLQILDRLLDNEKVTLDGRYYQLRDAQLLPAAPPVPIWVGASGDRMLDLTARYADGSNGGGPAGPDGEPFASRVAKMRERCRQAGRDPSAMTISYSANVMVAPDAAAARQIAEALTTKMPDITAADLQTRFVVGTPDEVATRLRRAVELGASHLICSVGPGPFSFWDEAMLDLFGSEVIPRLRSS